MKGMCCSLSFLSLIDRVNERWGRFIAAHPIKHVLLSLVAILIPSAFLINLRMEYDIRASFSPYHSRSMNETRVYNEFFAFSTLPKRMFVLFTAKDSGTMLRQHILAEVKKLDAEYMKVLQTKDPSTGISACHPLCKLNAPFHIITDELLKTNMNRNGSDLLLDYPNSLYFGNHIFIGSNFLNIKVQDKVFSQNNSRIVKVDVIVLWYVNRADTQQNRERVREATLDLFESSKEGLLEHVNFEVFGDDVANSEMVRGAVQATILMSIGFMLLLGFVFAVVYQKMRGIGLLEVLVIVATSILCPIIASAASFGLNTWLGNNTYTIMCVTPFLITGVGVDDAFILLQSFHQHRDIKCPEKRLSSVMVHTGPSITITSLTNTVAFGIGWLSVSAPQMSLFCFCTSLAVFFDYILTFTLLAPVLVILASLKGERGVPPRFPTLLIPDSHNKLTTTKSVAEDSTVEEKLHPWIYSYSKFLHSTVGRISAILVASVLIVVASFGVATMRPTFEPSKAFPSDSPLAHSVQSISRVFDEFFPIMFIVNRPPNVSESHSYDQFYQMVNELEDLPQMYGHEHTLLWLRSYEQFDRKYDHVLRILGVYSADYKLTYDNLDYFLEKLGYPPTIKTSIAKDNKSLSVDAFQFTVVARHMTEWWNRAVVEEKCRIIIDRYPQFNVSLYDGDSSILGLLLTVKSDLICSIAITIACMTIICSILIPNRLGVAAISVMIASICFTLIGLMSWWGADLDPVTMVDVLLATGFSVDYTAHIAHQYYTKSGSSLHRIGSSLHEMCPPMLQAGISTILCMLPLIFVPTYAIVAFAKTVFIVVGVGLLHGLFLLPTLLCFLPRTLSFSPVNEENPPTPTREILLPPVAETEATIPE